MQNERLNRTINRILQVVVLAYQGIALAAFLIIPFLASGWLRTPFLGAFVEQTMLFNGVGQQEPAGSWSLYLEKGLELKYQMIQVEDKSVTSERDIRAALKDYSVGDSVKVLVRNINNIEETKNIPVKLTDFPATARTLYLILPYIVGFIFLAASLWIFGLRRTEPAGRAFALLASSVAIGCAGLFDLYTTHYLTILWTLALTVASGALVDLAMVFPQEVRWVEKFPYLRWCGYVIGGLLFIWSLFYLYNWQQPDRYVAIWGYIYTLAAISILFFVGMVIYRRLRSKSPVVRQQAGVVLAGMVLSFVPLAGWFLITGPVMKLFFPAAAPLKNFPPLLLISLIFFPIFTGYSVIRQRLAQTDYLMRRGTLYAIMTVLAVAGYALLVSGLSMVFGNFFTANNPWIIGGMVFILALVLNPLRNRNG